MSGNVRHGPSRPDRTRAQAGRPPAGHRDSGPELIPAELAAVLERVVRAAGMDLESVRVTAAGRRRLLRVVVDADGGVGLDDIALISRELSARLDASGVMGDAPYTLEVSSPGVDRPLTEPRHWRRAAGRLVTVALVHSSPTHAAGPATRPAPVEGRVIEAGEDRVILDIAGEHREFGYAELGPGRVQVEFGRPEAGPGAGDSAAVAAGPRTRGRAGGH
jgi:ribosome maturation factor RimP